MVKLLFLRRPTRNVLDKQNVDELVVVSPFFMFLAVCFGSFS